MRWVPGLLPQGTASLLLMIWLLIVLVLLLVAYSSAPLLLVLVFVLHEGQALLQGWAVLGPLPLLRGRLSLLPPARHKLLLLLLHQRQPLLQAGEALQPVQVCDWLGLLRAPAACTGRLLPPCGVIKAKLHVFRVCPTSGRAPEAACWVHSIPGSGGCCRLPALLLPVTITEVFLLLAPGRPLLLPARNIICLFATLQCCLRCCSICSLE